MVAPTTELPGPLPRRGPLRLLGIVLIVEAALSVTHSIAWRVAMQLVRGGLEVREVEGLLAVFRGLSWAWPALLAVIAGAVVHAFRGTADAALRRLGLAAGAALGLLALHALLGLVLADWAGRPAASVASFTLSAVGRSGLAAALWVLGRRLGARRVTGVALAALVATLLAHAIALLAALLPDAFVETAPLSVGALARLGLRAAELGLVAAAALMAASRAPAGARAVAVGAGPLRIGSPAEWARAARGLRLYRGGLLWKLRFLIAGVVFLALAAASRSLPGVKAAMLLGALAGAGASIAMLVGLVRFTAVPEESGARGAAVATVVLWPLGLALEAWTLGLVLQMVPADGWDLVEHAEAIERLQPVAQVFGLVALAVLLVALRRAAAALDVGQAVGRAGILLRLTGLLVPAALVVRLEAVQRALGGPGLLLVALAVLGLAVAFVVLYLGLVRRLVTAMEAPEPSEGAPVAPAGGAPAGGAPA